MSPDDIIVSFPAGLIGFEKYTEYRLFEPSDGYPLRFLQSVEQPDISFACMDAAAVKMDYEVPLGEEDSKFLALEKPEDALVLVLIVVPEEPRRMTANLAGPLVINTRTMKGRQVVLDSREFPLQYPIIRLPEDVIVTFPTGLIGFSNLRTFRLFEPMGSYPIKFLQSIEQPEISFTCIDVAAIKMDYEFPLSDEEAKALALEKPEDALVLALVVIPQDPRKMTANLAGPLVINARTKEARQVVLNTEKFPLKYPIIKDRPEK
jgi:flagellar assembly factor FliW